MIKISFYGTLYSKFVLIFLIFGIFPARACTIDFSWVWPIYTCDWLVISHHQINGLQMTWSTVASHSSTRVDAGTYCNFLIYLFVFVPFSGISIKIFNFDFLLFENSLSFRLHLYIFYFFFDVNRDSKIDQKHYIIEDPWNYQQDPSSIRIFPIRTKTFSQCITAISSI